MLTGIAAVLIGWGLMTLYYKIEGYRHDAKLRKEQEKI